MVLPAETLSARMQTQCKALRQITDGAAGTLAGTQSEHLEAWYCVKEQVFQLLLKHRQELFLNARKHNMASKNSARTDVVLRNTVVCLELDKRLHRNTSLPTIPRLPSHPATLYSLSIRTQDIDIEGPMRTMWGRQSLIAQQTHIQHMSETAWYSCHMFLIPLRKTVHKLVQNRLPAKRG